MDLLFNETIYTIGINISHINSSNTEIKIIPYIDPVSEELINMSKYKLSWYVNSLQNRRMKILLNFSEPNEISTF